MKSAVQISCLRMVTLLLLATTIVITSGDTGGGILDEAQEGGGGGGGIGSPLLGETLAQFGNPVFVEQVEEPHPISDRSEVQVDKRAAINYRGRSVGRADKSKSPTPKPSSPNPKPRPKMGNPGPAARAAMKGASARSTGRKRTSGKGK